MNKKVGLKGKKLPLMAVVIILVFGGSVVAAYQTGVKNAKSDSVASNKDGSSSPDQDSEHLAALETQGGQLFENYKKQIEQNTAQGTDKMGLYINAATTGAAVDAPEAAGYAKQALELMTDAMKRDARSKDLISSLEKIAAGNYN